MKGAAARSGAPACAFVIFGVTGDLAHRKLLPSLYRLHADGRLASATAVIGHARTEMSRPAFQEAAAQAVTGAVGAEPADLNEFLQRLHYVQGSYSEASGFQRLRELLEELELPGRLFYTATPPVVYEEIARELHAAGLAAAPEGGFARLIIEKPFGHDLSSAEKLNASLKQWFREEQLFRIDHYLGKETAQNLAALRFANALFEPLWSGGYVDNVQIAVLEEVGVESRGGFYEGAGVIRDVFQNHLLQLMALVGMEPPARFDADTLRSEKVKFLSAVSCPEPQNAVLGQYVAGGGHEAYRNEPDVEANSQQATFAALELRVENWRWAGVPFYLRSGKRLERKATEIVLTLRNPPHVPFSLTAPLTPARIVLRISPDEGIDIRFNGKRPGQGIDLARIQLGFSYEETFDRPNPDAYETLLLDAMQGDASLFMRADEVEAQWRIVDPILRASGELPVLPYEAGGAGPAAAERLLTRSGREWAKPTGWR